MAINFESALGIHPKALKLRGERAEVLASNLANADTPNYKAKDFNFSSVLGFMEGFREGDRLKLKGVHDKHFPSTGTFKNPELLYRVPHQYSMDGNTVDQQVEKGLFSKNASSYQASFQFLNGKFKGLMNAIKGQ